MSADSTLSLTLMRCLKPWIKLSLTTFHLIQLFNTAGFADNCSTHCKPTISASDALKIEELQAEAKKAKAAGNLALYEALMAQAKNVIQKRDLN